MRVLHTADWHLGRSFHGHDLLSAQVAALGALVAVVEQEAVDVVVIAGDVFDRAVPPPAAVEACTELLHRLRRAGAVVVAISGNHDSASRLAFGAPLLADAGVHLRTDVRSVASPVVVPATDGGPPLLVYAVPYLEPALAAEALRDAQGAEAGEPEPGADGADRAGDPLGAGRRPGHDAVLRAALARARADLAQRGGTRSVAVAHAFVTGGATADSERALSVGGSAEVGLGAFAGFTYAALGHLHGRQALGDGRARYAGSPLPYSFSERRHVKGAWLASIPASGEMRVEAVDLPAGRPLAQLRGTLEQLLTAATFTADEGAWVRAVLTDAVLPPDAAVRLRRRFPHLACVEHEPAAPAAGVVARTWASRTRGRTDAELAADFLEHVLGEPPYARDLADLEAAVAAASADAAMAGDVGEVRVVGGAAGGDGTGGGAGAAA